MVKTSTGEVLTSFGGTITVANGYVLVDCVDGICKQTQGYVLDNDSGGKVIAFVGDGIEAVGVAAKGSNENKAKFSPDSITTIDGCADATIGKAYGIAGVCIYFKSPSTKIGAPFSTIDTTPVKKYIIDSSATGTAGTPFESEHDTIAIKSGPRYIIRDEFNSEGKELYSRH